MRNRILAVWTRDFDAGERAGRVNIARAVREVMASQADVGHARLHNLFEKPSARRFAAAAGAFLGGLLRGRPLPLQCLLFAAPPDGPAAIADAAGREVVYVDGVRPLLWLRRMRRRAPRAELVVDLDDLMSRRCDELLGKRIPLSLGYLQRILPRPVARVVGSRRLAGLVLRYERMALRRAECELLGMADRVVLLNGHEAALLAATPTPRGDARARIVTIPPPASALARAAANDAQPVTWRAVFIGMDSLAQNLLTIDHLLDLWDRARPAMPLVIYGRQTRPPRRVHNVTWAGYVDDIAQVYAPGSILLCPAFLRGGIKTKVLEGFAHGVPVAGNAASFEGLDLPGYPLRFDTDEALQRFLAAPADHAAAMQEAVATATDYLAREHAPEVFRARWVAALAAAGRPARQEPRPTPQAGSRLAEGAD